MAKDNSDEIKESLRLHDLGLADATGKIVEYRRADLRGADLCRADLRGADLCHREYTLKGK
jgi:uncharacterized protein YjbI with pentapeptide repeats